MGSADQSAGAASRLARLRPRVSGNSRSITTMIPEAKALKKAIAAPSGRVVWLINPTKAGRNAPIARLAL
jgi:hypothetical protein